MMTENSVRRNKGVTLLKDAQINAISLVNRGANNKRFFLFKRADNFIDELGTLLTSDNAEIETDDSLGVDKILPILKGTDLNANGDWKTVYCVVAVPGEVDQQEDVWPEDEIIKSAHDFLKQGPLINYMHADLNKVGDLVQSAVALTDITINGERIPKGSWYIAVEPHDEVRKQINSGYITGISIQGTSRRVPMDKAVDPTPASTAPTPNPVAAASPAKHSAPIPIGSEGPGIQKLQHILGITESGTYDEATQTAFCAFLAKNGYTDTPTLAVLQDTLARAKALEDHVNASSAPVAKDSGYASDCVGTNMNFGMNGLNYTVTGPLNDAPTVIGSPPSSQAAQNSQAPSKASDLVQMVSGDADPDDLKVALYLSAKRGNTLLMDHLTSVFGVAAPEDIFTTELSLQQLQLLVSMYILGVLPGGAKEPELADGDGNGMSTQLNKGWLPKDITQNDLDDGDFAWISDAYKAGKEPKSIGRKLPYKIHGKVNEAGWRAAWAAVNGSHGGTDFAGGADADATKAKLLKDKPKDITVNTKSDTVTDQSGNGLSVGDNVMMDPNDVGEDGDIGNNTDPIESSDEAQPAYIIAITSPYLGVMTNGKDGKPTHMVVHSKKTKKLKVTTKIKKAAIKAGDIVTWNNGANAGVVSSISGDSAMVQTQNKGSKAPTETKMKLSDLTSYDTKNPVETVTKALGSSYGGHAPSANGKIRFIVRAFGTWAGGLERVCATRIEAEHPEIVAGRDPNALCFVGGSLVETRDRGNIPIEDLIPYDPITKSGDWIKTHLGMHKPLLGTRANHAEGKNLYTIDSECLEKPLSVTEDHKILVARGAEFWPNGRIRKRSLKARSEAGISSETRSSITSLYPKQEIGKIEWARVQDIREHDYVLYPKSREVVDRPDISDDYLKLLGLFAAEGSSLDSGARWYFGIEEPLVKECSEAIEREFGFTPRVRRARTSDIVETNVRVSKALREGISGNVWTKRFEDWVLKLPKNRLRIVLDSYWDGDGHIRPNRNEAVANTVSRDLAYQLRTILIYLGERPSIKQSRSEREGVIEGRVVKCSDTWTVSYCPGIPSSRRQLLGNEDFIAFPIKSISVSKAPLWVYDINVGEDHSLVANGLLAHNCSWLKDQWLGNTHWRQGRQGVAKAVDDYLTNELLEELDADQLEILFETVSTDLGIDSQEVLEKMSTDEYNFYLNDLFPEEVEDESDLTEDEKSLVQKFLGIFKSSKSKDDKVAEARNLFISDEEVDTEKEQNVKEMLIKFESNLTEALQQDNKSESVNLMLTDFDNWVKDTFNSEREEAVTKNADSLSPVDVVNGHSNNGDNMENVEKGLGLDAEQLDRIQQTRNFLDSLLGNATTTTDSTDTGEVVEVEKDAAAEVVTEEVSEVDATETTLNDVISFVNRLAEHVEGLSKQAEESANLSEKLDTISELVKNVDVSDRLESLQTEIDALKLAVVPVTEEVAEVSKRLTQIGNTAGTRTSTTVNEEQTTVNKSVQAPAWTGRFY